MPRPKAVAVATKTRPCIVLYKATGKPAWEQVAWRSVIWLEVGVVIFTRIHNSLHFLALHRT